MTSFPFKFCFDYLVDFRYGFAKMSRRCSKFCFVPSLAVLAGGLLLGSNGRAAEPRHGRPIEFSDPKSAEITTNLNQFSIKRGGLRDLEVDLKSFQQGFSSRSSLDGIAEPPVRYSPPPVIQSKKARELLERKKNWAFMNPEDLTSGATAEQIFNLPEYGPDGKEKRKSSAVELYYERQEREQRSAAGKRDRGRESDDLFARRSAAGREDADLKDQMALSEELTESERSLRRALANSKTTDNLSSSDLGQSTFSDIFRLGNNTLPSDQLDAQKAYKKAYREQFEKLLDPSTITSTSPQLPSSLSGALDSSSVAPVPVFDHVQASSRSSVFDSTSGALSSPLQPSGLSDATAKALSPWNVTPSAFPKADQPKVTSPASLLDFVPTRKF